MSKWKKVKIGELLTESKVESLNPCASKRIRVRLNVKGLEKRPEKNETQGATKQYIRKTGQFIYGKQNFHKGAFGVVNEELDGFETSSDIPAFDVSKKCIPEWIFYFFKIGGKYLTLENLAVGVGSKRISPKKIFEIEIPLPNIEEQKKVVRKLKKIEQMGACLLSKSTSQKSRLKLLRQQILQDAISGKLTADWREKNPEKITGECSAEHLLAAIKAEKKKLIAEKKIKKEKPLPPIAADEVPFDVPNGWEWCRLGGVFASTSGATPTRGDNNFWKDGSINWLKSGEMNDGIIDSESEEKITKKGFEKSSTFLFPKETVLIAMYGATAGKLAILNIESTTNQAICGFLKNNFIEQKFLFYFLKVVRKKMVAESWGQAQPNISQTYLKSFLFPLPPRAEQKAIVAKVESLFAYLSQLEEKIQHNAMSAEHLMQAFLGEVFRK